MDTISIWKLVYDGHGAQLLYVYATFVDYPFITVRHTVYIPCNVHSLFYQMHPFLPHTPFIVLASDPSSEKPYCLYLHTTHQSYFLVIILVPLSSLIVFEHICVPLQGRVFVGHGLHQSAIPEAEHIVMCFLFIIIRNIPSLPPYTSLDSELVHEGRSICTLYILDFCVCFTICTLVCIDLLTHFLRHKYQT